MKSVVCFFVMILTTGVLHAKELKSFGEDIRALGMGGVRVPTTNHAGDFMYNPAYLSRISGIQWQFIDFSGGVNGLQAYNDFKSVNISGISSLSQLYGKHLWAATQGFSAVAFPYLGMAVYDNALLEMELHNPAFPYMDMTYQNEYGFILGMSTMLTPFVSFGLNAKRVTRFGGPQVIGAEILNSATLNQQALQDQFTNEGVGYGLDVGTLYKLPGSDLAPEIGITWQDVGDTAFQKTKGSTAPDHVRNNLTLSMTSRGEVPGAGFALGVEYRHITDADEQLGKKLHMGLELSLLMLDVRAGFSQGYYSYGLGMDMWFAQFDLAYYKAERGAYPGQTPDERIQAGFNMNFGFDPDFKLTEVGGKRRHLKQRR